MSFYFFVHVLLGVFFECSYRTSSGSILQSPKWVSQYGGMINSLTSLGCFAAIVTTFINYTIGWAGITFLEIALGIIIAKKLRPEIKIFMTMASVIGVPVILGSLWKFWYL